MTFTKHETTGDQPSPRRFGSAAKERSLDPRSRSHRRLASVTSTRGAEPSWHGAAALPNGHIFIYGGFNGDVAMNDAFVLDPGTERASAADGAALSARRGIAHRALSRYGPGPRATIRDVGVAQSQRRALAQRADRAHRDPAARRCGPLHLWRRRQRGALVRRRDLHPLRGSLSDAAVEASSARCVLPVYVWW